MMRPLWFYSFFVDYSILNFSIITYSRISSSGIQKYRIMMIRETNIENQLYFSEKYFPYYKMCVSAAFSLHCTHFETRHNGRPVLHVFSFIIPSKTLLILFFYTIAHFTHFSNLIIIINNKDTSSTSLFFSYNVLISISTHTDLYAFAKVEKHS